MDEEQILGLIKEKDLEAFTQLIVENKSLVEKIVFQYGIEPENVGVVVQETFVSMYRKINRLEPGKLLEWIVQHTFKTLKDYHKKNVNKKEELSTIEKQYGYYIENRQQKLIQTYLRKMDSKYKQPIILHYFHHKSIEEISTILNINRYSTQMRLKYGLELLKGKFEKAVVQESQRVSKEDNVIEQLRVLNNDYDQLPEFIDVQAIIKSIKNLKASHKWKKVLPTSVVIIGLITFSILTVMYIQRENERQVFQEQQENSEYEKEGIMNPEEKQVELDPEIVEYLEKAKELLANELGIEDINNFTDFQRLESILLSIIQHNPEDRAFVTDYQKDYINITLTPPSIAKEDLLNPDKQDEKFIAYLYTLSSFESEFQSYLDSLLLEYNIPIEQYDAIVSLQEEATNDEGVEKITKFIHTLYKQGYYLIRQPENDKITVGIDFSQVKENISLAGFNEGYLRYLDFAIEYGNQFNTNAWDEHDEILLELESIMKNYGDDYTETIKEFILSEINSNLHSFFLANPSPRPLLEQDRQVFYQFLDNNRDSVYWDIMNTAVEEYEATDWMETINPPDYTYIKILFDERFGDVKMADFEIRRHWPIETNSIVIYKELKESFEQSRLVDLNPVEMVSLYDYASEKDDNEVFNKLLALKTLPEDEEFNFNELRQHSSEYVFVEYPSEYNAIVHLADWNLENVTSVELIRDNNIWQIARVYKIISSY